MNTPVRDPVPFACGTRVRARTLPLARCVDAATVFGRLTAGGTTPGALLLESADAGGIAGTGSLVFPCPVLRLTQRRDRLRIEALDARGAALLLHLGERLAGAEHEDGRAVVAPAPRSVRDPSRTDRERLLSPSGLDAVRALIGLVGDGGGRPPIAVAGAFAYELVDRFEDLPPRKPDPLDEPDLDLVLCLEGIFYDHREATVTVSARALSGAGLDEAGEERAAEARCEAWCRALQEEPGPAPAPLAEPPLPAFRAETADGDFLRGVDRLLGHVAAGDIFQGVLSRALGVDSEAAPFAVYRELRAQNPSPYMFCFDLGDGALLGASPETCLRVTDRVAMLAPIAGTVPRGLRADGTPDPDRDTRLAVGLLLDAKEQSEHAMLIDLARNDLARICVPGTREVEAPFSIERYSHVQHLVSRVRGRLDDGLDALDAYRATANMGTLTGAPKLRAMELIREVEPSARGFYGGAVGYLTSRGDFDSCIVIRSLRHSEGRYTVRSGAGIVADSNPRRELAETLHKARAPLLAIARAERRGA